MDGKEGALLCRYAAASHVGGSGSSPTKQNQDAHFVADCGDSTMVWGVLDGHGPDNGILAAQTGAAALKDWCTSHVSELRAAPSAAMKGAFQAAHNAIRAALLRKYDAAGAALTPTREGFLIEADGNPVDGGTTATVVALIEGHLLVVANVGDSDALLGGALADEAIGFEQLCADHSATSTSEFLRVARLASSRPAEWEPALFVYESEDAEREVPIEIFAVSEEGEIGYDEDVRDNLDELQVGYKSARGDRPTALLVEESDDYGAQKLGFTRSLGDFFMQWHGATWEPAVSCIDLAEVAAQLERVTLLIGSDGLWDLWQYKEALAYPLRAPPPFEGDEAADSGSAMLAPLAELVEDTRERGEELFGESADNITALVVSFEFVGDGDDDDTRV